MVKLVIQRVHSASVSVDKQLVSSIQKGILCLLGINRYDSEVEVEKMAKKVCGIRLWEKNEVFFNL